MSMTVFSFRTLAWAWTSLGSAALSGAAALQLAGAVPPPPAPLAAAAMPAPAAAAAVVPIAPPTPLPFQNHSLLAMLPPVEQRTAGHPQPAALPVPPIPPQERHAARIEPRRPLPAYAAQPRPAYPGWAWAQPAPYPGRYAYVRAYSYAAPPGYYGWQP